MDPILIINIVGQLLDVANKARTALIQSKEWTAEQEAEFQKKLETSFASDAWKPHGPL